MPFSLPAKRSLETVPLLLLTFILLAPSLLLANDFKVIKVYDGDTIRVEGYGTKFNVRLAGIDAPELCVEKKELGQPLSEEAQEYLSGLILNKVVEIKGYGNKRYDLLWGEIFLDGKDINLDLVRMGYAQVYGGKSPQGFNPEPYLKAEKEAKAAKSGIWAQGETYVSPSDWRKTQKVRSGCAVLLYGIYQQKLK